MTDYSTILVERKGAVTLVTLNRPQALNALNSEVLKELIDAFAAYDADPSQRCLVLTGSEKAFAAERIARDRGDPRLARRGNLLPAGKEVRGIHVGEQLLLHLLDVRSGGEGFF